MGRLLEYHIVFEEGTQGEGRRGLYDQARRHLEKKLMIAHHEGNISFMPLGIKKLNDGKEKEIENGIERIYYKGELEGKDFQVVGEDGRRFPKKER